MLEITVVGALVGLAKFPPFLPLEDGEHNHIDQPGKPGGLFEVLITNTILIGSHKNPGTKTEFVRLCVDVWCNGHSFQLLNDSTRYYGLKPPCLMVAAIFARKTWKMKQNTRNQ